MKKEIESLAEIYECPVILISSYAHEIQGGENVQVIVVDNIPEAADLAIANRIKKGDIAVTQDYGLAAMCLGKKASVLSPRGRVFKEKDIDLYLDQRHHARKSRRTKVGRKTLKGPPAFSQDDRNQFARSLTLLIKESLESHGESAK